MSVARNNQEQQLKTCAGTSQLLKNDRISELSDDILICILSFLTMKEAGRTSFLSKRWRHLWAYIPTLWFDSRKLIYEFKMETKSPKVEGPRYLHWVEQVVRSYKAPTIDEFKVQFDISYLQNSSCSIDNFIRFALEKKVKRLEVDLSLYCGGVQPTRHTFNCVSFCNSLTSLVLGCVNITAEMLESFLWNCQALEYLSVHRSDTLLSLKVTGRSRNLKTIRICKCFNIKQFEISAPNLVSVCFFGPKMNVEFQSTPKLVEVSLGSLYANDLDSCFSDLSGYHSQIEALSLDPMSSLGNVMLSVEDPIFTRLKKLDMTVQPAWDDDLNCFELLLKACPFLHHFKLQLILYEEDSEERDGLRKLEAYPHYCLKVVEILGFVGYPVDLEIAAFLIESAVSLEKIVLDPRELCTLGGPWEFEDTPEKIHARDKAKHLRTNLKPGTELEIL